MKINNITDNEDGSADVELELTTKENNILVQHAMNDILEDYISSYQSSKNHKVMYLGNGMYRLACDCTCEDHDITLDFQYDDEFHIAEMVFYMDFYSDSDINNYRDSYKDNFFKKFFKTLYFRVKYSLLLIFKGYIRVSHEVIFSKPEHIDSFINALYKSKEWMEEHQRNIKPKE